MAVDRGGGNVRKVRRPWRGTPTPDEPAAERHSIDQPHRLDPEPLRHGDMPGRSSAAPKQTCGTPASADVSPTCLLGRITRSSRHDAGRRRRPVGLQRAVSTTTVSGHRMGLRQRLNDLLSPTMRRLTRRTDLASHRPTCRHNAPPMLGPEQTSVLNASRVRSAISGRRRHPVRAARPPPRTQSGRGQRAGARRVSSATTARFWAPATTSAYRPHLAATAPDRTSPSGTESHSRSGHHQHRQRVR